MSNSHLRTSFGFYFRAAMIILCVSAAAFAQTPFEDKSRSVPDPLQQRFTELEPGVWLGNRPDSTRLPVTPNTTFVISTVGVVVFDGGNLPLVADRVIAKIRELTDKPVTHVIISHWHMDHVLGVSRYVSAYPGVQVIAHPYTRELIYRYLGQREEEMRNTVSSNAPAIENLLKERGDSLDPKTKAWFSDMLDFADLLESQYRNFDAAYPSITFTGELRIHSGDREIHVLHPGTGNTPGDLILWLPKEKILASGDIVVWPTPYGHGGRPSEWAQTLHALMALDFRMLIPGHGEVQVDRGYLALMAETLYSIVAQMDVLAANGLTQEEARAELDLSAFERRFTGGDVFLADRFNEWFAGPIADAAWLIATGKDPEIVQ